MAKAMQRGSGDQSGSGASGSASQRGPGAPDDPKDVLAEALQRADEAYLAERTNIIEGRDCQAFYANAGGFGQWDAAALAARQKDGRPVLTINMLPQFVKQMTGDVRKNPPSIKVLPAGGRATKDTAEAFDGIIRNIEQQSGAEDVYIKALDNVGQAGQGWITVTTEYSDVDVFEEKDPKAKKGKATKRDIREQDIRIRAVLDPFGALVDPFPKLIDKSDIKYGFVFETWSLAEFKKEFPDVSPVDFPKMDAQGMFSGFPWRSADSVTIAAYWRRVPCKKTIYQLLDGSVTDDPKHLGPPGAPPPPPELVEQWVASGEIPTREVDTFKVEMWRMTGNALLDDKPHPFPGKYIPIVMVPGEEITRDGSTIRKGMVHDARDAQRIYNYTRSASVEAVALQPKAPFIGTVDMFKGRTEWATAGSKNHSFLAYVPDRNAPGMKPERSAPPIASQGLDSQSMIAAEDVKRVTGIHDASLGAQSNETSGVAIQARQQEGDTATFVFPFNLSRALAVVGKILVEIIPKVYDNERQLRLLKPDGTAKMVTVNGQPQPNEKTGEPSHPLYDLGDGKYDVAVTTGPTFATQRREAVTGMVEVIRADPTIMKIGGDLLVQNMDWPGADELAKRMRKASGIPEPDEPPPPPPPPPPDVMADVEKTIADTRKVEAETQGKQLENMTMMAQLQAMGMQMNAMMQAIQSGQMQPQQMLAGGAPMGGPPGMGPSAGIGMGAPMSPPGAPMPTPPPAPPPAQGVSPSPPSAPADGDLPPMVEVGGDDLPPMVEVGDEMGTAPPAEASYDPMTTTEPPPHTFAPEPAPAAAQAGPMDQLAPLIMQAIERFAGAIEQQGEVIGEAIVAQGAKIESAAAQQAQSIAGLADAMTAEQEVVRDDEGRVKGSRRKSKDLN
jgi:hypothetical protein